MTASRSRPIWRHQVAIATFIGFLGTAAFADIGPLINRPVAKARVITNPDWTRRPTGYELSEFYPPAALAMRMNGFASINCAVVVDGTLEDCRVVTEDPYGVGFGDAAVKMTSFFAMRPKLIDGAPVAGARVIIPIRFKLPGSSEPPAVGSPPPTPKALALARRAVLAQHGDASVRHAVDQYVESFASGLEQSSAGVLSPEVEATIKKAKEESYADIPALLENDAVVIASSMSDSQLEVVADFLESPAGQAWAEAGASNQATFARLSEDFQKSIFKRLCNATRCTPVPLKP